jgi:DNA-binding CsgD family transcriptional regulator
MELLEREPHLATLEEALKEAQGGNGRVALVCGEAGIGKTALVRYCAAEVVPPTRVLWGACDALFTPQPLGPLYDIAPEMGAVLLPLLEEGRDWLTIARSLLTGLARKTTVLVIEDIHWADEATLDLLKYLGRRLYALPALLILTYRNDALAPDHPLRQVLGSLGPTIVHRIELTGLSEAAVRTLAQGTAVDPALLHRQTNGNPFFVTEALASSSAVPATVRDAVLARAARLSPAGRSVLEAAAVIGTRVEPWLFMQVTGAAAAVIDECLSVGILQAEGKVLAFRHEIARQVILEAMSPTQRLGWHRLTLAALMASDIAELRPDRLAHHAEAAEDAAATQHFAVVAARQASVAHSHREAASQYARALRFSSGLSAAARARLWEDYGQACGVVGQHGSALAAFREAARIWRETGAPLREGNSLTQMAIFQVRTGQIDQARESNRQAMAILESQPPSRELAYAYSLQAELHVLEREVAETVSWDKKAEALALEFEDTEILALTYLSMGIALMAAGDDKGHRYLERSLAISRESGHDLTAAVAIENLAATALETYQISLADQYLAEGFAFCYECQMDYFHLRMLAGQALSHLHHGRWIEAEAVAGELLNQPDLGIDRLEALVVMARLHLRRGTPGAAALLDEALVLATETGLLPELAPVRAARAEAAWLTGDMKAVRAEACAAYELAESRRHPWLTGELAFWRWRAGDTFSLPAWTALPFAAQIQGDWQKAAAEWERRACPYQQAQALADGDQAAQLAALAIFDQLGARPAANMLRRKLHPSRTHGLPRGPRPATRANPFGLTPRQMEILLLIADGLSNAEIAARLVISQRTVEHHVAAILAKLDVASRHEATALAHEHRLIPSAHASET